MHLRFVDDRGGDTEGDSGLAQADPDDRPHERRVPDPGAVFAELVGDHEHVPDGERGTPADGADDGGRGRDVDGHSGVQLAPRAVRRPPALSQDTRQPGEAQDEVQLPQRDRGDTTPTMEQIEGDAGQRNCHRPPDGGWLPQPRAPHHLYVHPFDERTGRERRERWAAGPF